MLICMQHQAAVFVDMRKYSDFSGTQGIFFKGRNELYVLKIAVEEEFLQFCIIRIYLYGVE